MENIIVLVEKSRAGDRDAFARIIEKYKGLVSAVTLNIVGDYTLSEDLAQEVFLTAWKKLPELREPEKASSWIYGIARRIALHWRERQQTNPLHGAVRFDDQTMSDLPAQAEAERRRQQEESLRMVWSTVKGLPESVREPLLLYYRYSRSIADIAELMQLTEQAVRQRLSRGRKMLKAEVEQRVRSVLEATRPDDRFVVAVLAAIPVLATSTEVFAATSAAGSAGVGVKSSGGVPFLAGFTVYLATLADAIFFPLALFFGVLSGAWNGIRNSPTLRSRRYMLKATIFQTTVGLTIYLFLCVSGRSLNLFMSMDGPSFMKTDVGKFFIASIFLIGFYSIVSSYVINRNWRRIVEEDAKRPVDTAALESSRLSIRRLRRFFGYCMPIPAAPVLPVALLTMLAFERHGLDWRIYFEHLPRIYPVNVVILPFLFVSIVLTAFYFFAEKMVRDEKSLEVRPPRRSNFLQVLQGVEEPGKGIRARTNLVSDLLLVGVGLCMIQGAICANFFFKPSPGLFLQGCYLAVFTISFVAYLLFAAFYAGLPRKRYFGYVYFGLFFIVFNALFVLWVEPWLYHRPGETAPPWHADRLVLGLCSYWIGCFVLTGAAGLLAFRKRKPADRKP